MSVWTVQTLIPIISWYYGIVKVPELIVASIEQIYKTERFSSRAFIICN